MDRTTVSPVSSGAETQAGFQPEIVRAVEPRVPAGAPRLWKGLLWCEWFAHSRFLLTFLALWLAAVWTLPLFAYPGWIVLIGLAYAVLAGPAYGGGDVLEGCEEFSFALPATRGQRYLARLLVGGGALLIFTGMNLLALGFDLPQALARFYLDTGLVRPFQVANPGTLYGLVLAFPFAVFAGAFALASATQSRTVVLTSWFWSLVGSLTLLFAGVEYESLVWNRINGAFANPLLLLGGAAILWSGYRCYRRKEVSPASRPLQLPNKWWLWVMAFLAGVVGAFALLLLLARRLPQIIEVLK